MNSNPRNLSLPVEKGINIVDVLPNIISRSDVNSPQVPSQDVLQVFPNIVYKSIKQQYKDYMDLVVSTGLRTRLDVEITSPVWLVVSFQEAVNESEAGLMKNRASASLQYMSKMRGCLNKGPGMSMGKLTTAAQNSAVPISIEQFKQILGEVQRSVDKNANSTEPIDFDAVPLNVRDLYLLLGRECTLQEREQIMDLIRGAVHPDTAITDVNSLVSTVRNTTIVLDVFFIVFGVVSILMCFFVLWISFTANVRENGWEFGVLRSLGLTGWQTTRVYVYEALSLVSTCILFGSIIGIGVAITLTIQSTMMTELPFVYLFPWQLFVAAVILSLFVAVVGSIAAAWSMKAKDIASVIRSGS